MRLLLALLLVSVVAVGSWNWWRGRGERDLTTAAGYLTSWDEQRGLQSLGEAGNVLTEVSPVWYQLSPTGVQPNDEARRLSSPRGPVAEEAKRQGLRVIPTISNFHDGKWDGQLVADQIAPSRRSGHVAEIASLVQREAYDGVDIDYEQLPADQRDDFSDFVRELAREMHRQGKKLTVAVHAKTVEPSSTPGAQAQDYAALGAVADQVRVMAYDYHWSTSPPGPIAPLDWVRDVLEFAIDKMPRDRVVLGLGAYGYDWVGSRGRNIMWSEADELARAEGVRVERDPNQVPWFSYFEGGRQHTVWYEDAQSAAAKVEIAKDLRIRGAFLWKLGGEDPALWELLEAVR